MTSYRDLEIFKVSKRLAIQIHEMTLKLPKFELYEEGSQIRRSSKAVSPAIVEGCARRKYKPDFIRLLIYSICECDETLLHLDFLHETKSLNEAGVYNYLRDEYIQLSKRINRFIQWVEESYNVSNK